MEETRSDDSELEDYNGVEGIVKVPLKEYDCPVKTIGYFTDSDNEHHAIYRYKGRYTTRLDRMGDVEDFTSLKHFTKEEARRIATDEGTFVDNQIRKTLEKPWRFCCRYCGCQFQAMRNLSRHVIGRVISNKGGSRKYVSIGCPSRIKRDGIELIGGKVNRFPVKQVKVPPKEYPWAYIICLTPDDPSCRKRDAICVPRKIKKEYQEWMGPDERAEDYRPSPEAKLPDLTEDQYHF